MASSLEPRLLVGAHDGDLSDGDPSSVEESLFSATPVVKVRIVGAILLSCDSSLVAKWGSTGIVNGQGMADQGAVTLTFDPSGMAVLRSDYTSRTGGLSGRSDLDRVDLFGWEEINGFLLESIRRGWFAHEDRLDHGVERYSPVKSHSTRAIHASQEGLPRHHRAYNKGIVLEVLTARGAFKLLLAGLSYTSVSSLLVVARSLAYQSDQPNLSKSKAGSNAMNGREAALVGRGLEHSEGTKTTSTFRKNFREKSTARTRSVMNRLRPVLVLLVVGLVLCAIALSLAQSAGIVHLPVVNEVNEAQVPTQANG